jgi:beta-fructofuranosidase
MNDHSFIRHNGIWHLFHIWLDSALDNVIGHATSENLKNWKRQPDILPKDPPPSWESDRGGNAPYVYCWDGLFHLFYSRYREGMQQIGLATSTDLFEWRKHPGNPIFHPAPFWCPWEEAERSSQFRPGCCRDPHVIRVGNEFIMYYVAMTREPKDICAVACCVSDDLVHWRDKGPVLTMPTSPDIGQCMMESPCVVYARNRWHLFYTQGRGIHHAVGDNPFHYSRPGFFCSAHACEVFMDGEGGWLISNCSKPPGLSHTRDAATKELSLARMAFEKVNPVLCRFE